MNTHLRTVNGREVKIHTSHVLPPIPIRTHDWSAVTDEYDVDCDESGYFSTHPQGAGSTEDAAIADLLGQLEARES